MYLSDKESRVRRREAQNARNNRAEAVRALSSGQVTRRELFRWGILTAAGAVACKNGLSPLARSAYAAVPTGIPRSPVFGVKPFTQPLPRLNLQAPQPLTPVLRSGETDLHFATGTNEPPARRLSYHTDFDASGGADFRNPRYSKGPMEGRPPGEFFAHQRWQQFLPRQGYVMSLAPLDGGYALHPDLPEQGNEYIWTFGNGQTKKSVLPPPLIKVRYGEPVIFRHYNALNDDPTKNGGFGSISQATHNHNAHNASASDGASNTHFFPGQFYDYHWSTTLARADMINKDATDPLASGPDGNGGLVHVAGDFRELQGTLWFHDHRFFYTAENVYKGHLGMLNYYSGKDRGQEVLEDGVNLRLPSGTELDWGNVDFDVNLMISDAATDADGQLFFDIFETDGFLGDLVLVNFAYKPFMEVLPRKYRFRVLAAGMSRFWKFALLNEQGRFVPMTVIAADGNLLVSPVTVTQLDPQGVAERFDVVVDFSAFQVGNRLRLINLMEHENGRKPKGTLPLKDILNGRTDDPAVGDVMQFRLVDRVASVDAPGKAHYASDPDRSKVPVQLTEQIPIAAPVRERVIEFKGADRLADELTGPCFPECGEKESFPWTIRINGKSNHFLNANRSSLLVPKPGEVEHWTLVNGGGGWDHPIHLHFEEGVTMSRGGTKLSAIERLARKDVWRLNPNGSVKFQVRFGEYGGAYVTHCHNTVHEDWAMLLRYDIQTDPKDPNQSQFHVTVVPTPDPTPEGVHFLTPEILPEGNPFAKGFNSRPKIGT